MIVAVPVRGLVAVALLALAACGSLPGRLLNEETPPPEPTETQASTASEAAPATLGGTVVVAPGDSVYKIARRNNVSVRGLIAENGLVAPYVLRAGQTLRLPTELLHEVVKGDTLSGLAQRYDVAMSELARANDLHEPYVIALGQLLRIPVPAAQPQVVQAGAVPAAAVETTAVPATTTSAGQVQASAAQVQATGQGNTIVTSVSPNAAGAVGVGTGAVEAVPAAASSVAIEPVAAPEPTQSAATASTGDDAAALAAAVEAEPEPATIASTVPEPVATAVPAEQVAVVAPAAPAAAAVPQPAPRSDTTFVWPVKGKVVSSFGPKGEGLNNDGINIAAPRGTPVVAAENGIVVYAGNEVPGFGNLVLIRHADGWATAYAHNENLLVQKNDKVKRGQVIGYVGATGNVSTPQSHFELRRDNDPVDPVPYLASN